MNSETNIISRPFNIQAGQLAIATISNLSFKKSVILLLRHDDKFTLGLNLTESLGPDLYKAFVETNPQLDLLKTNEQKTICNGGPVANGQYPWPQENGELAYKCDVTFLHDAQSGPETAHKVENIENMAYSTTILGDRMLPSYVTHNPTDTKIIYGYTGWSPGQLAAESSPGQMGFRDGAWAFIPAAHDLVFKTAPGDLWKKCASIAGIRTKVPTNIGFKALDI